MTPAGSSNADHDPTCSRDRHPPRGPTDYLRNIPRRLTSRFFQDLKPPASEGEPGDRHGEALMIGLRYHRAGNLRQAEEVYRQILRVDADRVDALRLLGATCQASGRLAEAAACYREALGRCPDDAETRYNLGNIFYLLGHFAEAAACYREALGRCPDDAEIRNNLGAALADEGRLSEALASYQEALRLRPDYPEAHYNMGNALRLLDRPAEAVECYGRSLRLRPDWPEVFNNMGLALAQQDRLAEAVECYGRSLSLRPDYPEAYNNLGLALADQGRLTEALDAYRQALRLRPDQAEWHRNRAFALLLGGDFGQGWPGYEWRRFCQDHPAPPPGRPLWDGSLLTGRTILLTAEQGAGDTLQFVRYAPLVRRRGGRVILSAHEDMLPILGCCSGIDQLVARGAPLPAFDVHAPLLSLPAIFATTVATIPAEVPYLTPDAVLVEFWRRELSSTPQFKIGIAWQGNPGIRYDRRRSFPLRHFAALARIDGVRLLSLQKGAGAEQLDEVSDRVPLTDLGSRLDRGAGAFMDTAAALIQLDLVITADTAIAHLAGALNVPVWVVLPFVPDWRWLLGRDDSPWYPSMRLFRQEQPGDWDAVFERVARALRRTVAARQGVRPVPIEISPGELIDRITILELKAEWITDGVARANVRDELARLLGARERALPHLAELDALTAELKAVNEAIWRAEDELRACERERLFGPQFVEWARSVYLHNDRRAALKRFIDDRLGSSLTEEKAYTRYG
jgi:tetratricopeptide (TPR) repeat protein